MCKTVTNFNLFVILVAIAMSMTHWRKNSDRISDQTERFMCRAATRETHGARYEFQYSILKNYGEAARNSFSDWAVTTDSPFAYIIIHRRSIDSDRPLKFLIWSCFDSDIFISMFGETNENRIKLFLVLHFRCSTFSLWFPLSFHALLVKMATNGLTKSFSFYCFHFEWLTLKRITFARLFFHLRFSIRFVRRKENETNSWEATNKAIE